MINVDNIYRSFHLKCVRKQYQRRKWRGQTQLLVKLKVKYVCIQYFQVKEGKAYLHEQNSQLMLIFLRNLIHFRSVWGFGRLS